MPNLQSVQSALRAGNYRFRGFISVVPETVIFSRAVNMPGGVPEPCLYLDYDDAYSGAGSYTDVPEDAEMIVYVGNTSVVRGRLRVAYGGASSSRIQVNEVSRGRIAIEDNDRFDVVDAYRLRDKLVAANATFDKDSRRTYADEGEEPAPVVVVGSGAAGIVDPVTGLLTVEFDAGDSYPTDPDNTGGLTYLWDVGDGTITVGSTSTAAITATFSAATAMFRHVTLVVTDADTGKSTTRKIPVWSHDVDNPPIPVRRVTTTLDRQNGSSATFELTAQCDVDTLREGALIYYWEREWYGDIEVSYGNAVSSRSNIKFVGYLRRETISITPETDTLSIEAISPLQKLGELAGFSQALLEKASPANWQEDEAVSIHKILWYVLHYHSTWSVNFDLLLDVPDYDYPEFFVQETVLLEQMRELASAVSAAFTCDRTGRFIVARNLQRGTTSERNAADVALALTARDLREIPSLVYEHSYEFNQVIGKAFSTTGDPMLAVAPGEAPAEAPERSAVERLITGALMAAQTELNMITGFAFAEFNSLYDGDGVPKDFILKPFASYDVLDPAYAQWLTVTLAASTNRRGRFFAGDRFILQRAEIVADPDSGTKDISWTVDHETTGAAGTKRDVPPEASLPDYTPPVWIPPVYAPPTSVPRIPEWNGVDQMPTSILASDAGGEHFAYALSWSPTASTINWVENSTGLSGAGSSRGFSCDPFDYRRVFDVRANGLYRNDNPKAGDSWTLVADNTAMFGGSGSGHKIIMSINKRGWLMVLSGVSGAAVSFDHGATWTQVGIHGGTPTFGSPSTDACDVVVSPYNSGGEGWVYSTRQTSSDIWRVYKSTNWGLNWSLISPELGYAGRLNIPYVREDGTTPNTNDSSQLLYMQGGDENNRGVVWRSQSAGVSWSQRWNVNAGGAARKPDPTRMATSGVETFTWDGSIVFSVVGQDQGEVRLSLDSGATHTFMGGNVGLNTRARLGVHGFALAASSWLWFAQANGTGDLRWTHNAGANIRQAAKPAFFDGNFADVQWTLDDFVPPA